MTGPFLAMCMDCGITKCQMIVVRQDAEGAFGRAGVEEAHFAEMGDEELGFFLGEENGRVSKLMAPIVA